MKKEFLTPSRLEKLEKMQEFRLLDIPEKFDTGQCLIEFAKLLQETRQSIVSSFSDEEANGFVVPTNNGLAMSSLEPSNENRWRVTYFHYLEPDEPTGHTECLSRDEAINCLINLFSQSVFSKVRDFM